MTLMITKTKYLSNGVPMYWMTSLPIMIITQLIIAGIVMTLGVLIAESKDEPKWWRIIGGVIFLLACLSTYQIYFIMYIFYS